MSLSQTLATAVSGLRVAQSGMTLVAANVSNAQTPGYVRKTLDQSSTPVGEFGISVRTDGINRVLDQYVQTQFRTESSGGAFADIRSQFYTRLQQIYGDPGGTGSLETTYSNFTTALQALATSPADYSARAGALSSAQALTQQLNGMTGDVQDLRSNAESAIANDVTRANNDMQQIARLNQALATAQSSDTAAATLMDQRDQYIDDLSQLMDVRVAYGDYNQANVFTTSGIQLVGTTASQLSFDATGQMTANSKWTADPATRGVGTITLVSPTGGSVDLIANKSIRSGEIAGLIDMRDNVLVQAQTQLDGLAAAMSRGLSDVADTGTPVTSGAQSGVDVDAGGLLQGNSIDIAYKDTATGAVRHISVVNADPAVLPLPPSGDPNHDVIGFDFSQGIGALAGMLNGKYAGKIQVSNPSGTTLRVLDDGALNKTDVVGVTATRTTTTFNSGNSALPFFTDGNQPFTGATTPAGQAITGLAGRITVNSTLLSNPSLLVQYQNGVADGDATRPNFIYTQLTSSISAFAPNTGIGTTVAPFSGSIPTYIQQVISQQGAAADAASQLQQGQDVVVNALKQRMADTSGVNIDQEMSQLLVLQNSYAANARVLSAVRDMLNALMQM